MSIALKNGISRILFMSISVSQSMGDCQLMTTHGISAGKESTYNAGDPWVRKIPCRRDWLPAPVFLGFPGGSDERICPQCGRPRFHPWTGKIPWRKEWLPSSSILAWRTPWTEEPGGLWSMVLQRVGQWLSAFHFHFHSKQPCIPTIQSCSQSWWIRFSSLGGK